MVECRANPGANQSGAGAVRLCDRRMVNRRHARRGFTLIEAVVTFTAIAIVTSLLLVGVSSVVRTSRISAEQNYLRTLSQAIVAFKNEYKFYPPLLRDVRSVAGAYVDEDPLDTGSVPPRMRLAGDTGSGDRLANVAAFLRSDPNTDLDAPRFSTRSLAVYLGGVMGASVDGFDGDGMASPLEDGTFAQDRRRRAPFLDLTKDSFRLQRTAPTANTPQATQLNDRWLTPIRYYRWEPRRLAAGTLQGGQVDTVNSRWPAAVGNPANNAALRAARFAVVSAGPDRRINDQDPDAPENRDNIVEFGQ